MAHAPPHDMPLHEAPPPSPLERIGEKLISKLDGIRREAREQGIKSQMETRAATVGANIRTFSGESTKKFKEWIKDMERAGYQVEADDSRMKAMCLQSLSGVAADFFLRFLKEKR